MVGAGFEAISLPSGGFTIGNVPGWSVTGTGGLFNPTASQFPSGASQGQNVAYSNGGTIRQDLSTALAPGTYTLNVDVGARLDTPFPGYSVQLWAGNTLLAKDVGSLSPRPGTFATSAVTYQAAAGDPSLGQPLSIRLTSAGGQVDFDNVRLVSNIGATFTSLASVVADFGAVGNGVADDTQAIQAAINAAEAASGSGVVYFPPGTYKITAPLTINSRVALLGASRDSAVIIQYTANTPILSAVMSDAHGNAYGIRVEHLGFNFATAPSATTVQQYAIQFRADPTGSQFSYNGFDLCTFNDLRISRAYVGIGAYTTGGGACPIWSSSFTNLQFLDIAHNAINLSNATQAGQPNDLIQSVHIVNSDPTIVNDSMAVKASATQGLVINDLNVEGWHDCVLYIDGGGYAAITGLQTENQVMTGASSAIYLANGPFVLNGVSLDLRTVGTGPYRALDSGGGAQVTANNFQVDRAVGSTSQEVIYALHGDPSQGTRLVASSIQLAGAGILLQPPATYDQGEFALVSVDGLPPQVDALPAASATYLGRQFALGKSVYLCAVVNGSYFWTSSSAPSHPAAAVAATPGLTVSPDTGLTTTKSGGSVVFSVVLNSRPAAAVVVPVASGNASEGTVSTSSLTFTPSNWSVPQDVTVIGVNDHNGGDVPYSIVISPTTSADPSYSGVITAPVPVLNVNEDYTAVRNNAFVVTDFGAVGNGVADDTQAIQAAINAAASATGNRVVYIPAGTYKITAPLTVNASRIALVGASNGSVVLLQYTPNTPILTWSSDLNGTASGIRVEHLGLTFATAPSATTTQQWAIQLRADPTGTAVGTGFSSCLFNDLTIINAYVGIGAYTTGGGSCPVQSSAFTNILFNDTAHSAIKLTGAVTGVQSNDRLESINVLNYNLAIVNDAEAIAFTSAQGLGIENLNVEDWHDRILTLVGGSASITGLRTERHVMTGASAAIFLAGGSFTLNGSDLDLKTVGTGPVLGLDAEAGAKVNVNALQVDRAAGSPSQAVIYALHGDPVTGSRVIATSVQLLSAGILLQPPATYDQGEFALVSVDGLPPQVDTLPTASSTYLGRQFTVAGTLYLCVLTNGVYTWTAS